MSWLLLSLFFFWLALLVVVAVAHDQKTDLAQLGFDPSVDVESQCGQRRGKEGKNHGRG